MSGALQLPEKQWLHLSSSQLWFEKTLFESAMLGQITGAAGAVALCHSTIQILETPFTCTIGYT
eukprot:jgi/Botrbrau1/19549/Bobra.0035s0041.1